MIISARIAANLRHRSRLARPPKRGCAVLEQDWQHQNCHHDAEAAMLIAVL
jgi:hypothetical protein